MVKIDWSGLVFKEMFFFFSSRRGHTICALVTGVQTCALPICINTCKRTGQFLGSRSRRSGVVIANLLLQYRECRCGHRPPLDGGRASLVEYLLCTRELLPAPEGLVEIRSEESRVGRGCVRKCSTWWSPLYKKKNKKINKI